MDLKEEIKKETNKLAKGNPPVHLATIIWNLFHSGKSFSYNELKEIIVTE